MSVSDFSTIPHHTMEKYKQKRPPQAIAHPRRWLGRYIFGCAAREADRRASLPNLANQQAN